MVAFAASPMIALKLQVRQSGPPAPIHAVLLRCQVRIEPAKRRYDAREQEQLRDLFDRPERWGQTLQSLLWTHVNATVPPFGERIEIDLPVPCSFDFNIAASKYFHALEGGEAPLTLLFSGTIFYEGPGGAMQVAQIPWEKEAPFRLPVRVWEEMMAHYYPNSAWLCLRSDAFDRLETYKRQHGLPTWEAVIERLIPETKEPRTR